MVTFLKQESLIEVTVFEIEMDDNDEYPSKQISQSKIIIFEIETIVNEGHF
jgi:hypothetical protein